MEVQLIKSLLVNDNYLAVTGKLRKSIFSDDAGQLFDLLSSAHKKYETDLKPDDLYSLWVADNPVATVEKSAEILQILAST